MIRVSEKMEFYGCVAMLKDSRWPIAGGVSFVCRWEHRDWGIALEIDSRALLPQQLENALARRFKSPRKFDNYFLFLDTQHNFVIWHALDEQNFDQVLVDNIRGHQLGLVGLEHLDPRGEEQANPVH